MIQSNLKIKYKKVVKVKTKKEVAPSANTTTKATKTSVSTEKA